MCKCPLHNDKNPSMKVDRRFHCFGCQADGDVISFTSRLFHIPPREAALKLADEFGIQHDQQKAEPHVRKHYQIKAEDILAHKISYCIRELTIYRNQLLMWKKQYTPQKADEDWHPLFLEALIHLDKVESSLDILLSGSDHDKEEMANELINTEHKKEERLMEPVVNTPIYHDSAEHARKFGELDQFRASHWANIDCKKDIEKAIARHFDGMHLDKEAVSEVLEQYGPERVSMVLAATVQVKAWDGRFSSANKDWAFTFDFPDAMIDLGFDRRDNYAVNTHPAVLNGFIDLARQEIRTMEQPTIKEENKYAVLLTDAQEIKVLECDPQEEMFEIARGTIGCDWIELVEPESLSKQAYVLMIDEEGKLRDHPASINCIASEMYGSYRHGDPIVGNAVIVRAADERLELLSKTEAEVLADSLNRKRDLAIDKISKAFGILPSADSQPDRRQPCRKNSMER